MDYEVIVQAKNEEEAHEKAEKELGWNNKIGIDELVKDMIDTEVSNINKK